MGAPAPSAPPAATRTCQIGGFLARGASAHLAESPRECDQAGTCANDTHSQRPTPHAPGPSLAPLRAPLKWFTTEEASLELAFRWSGHLHRAILSSRAGERRHPRDAVCGPRIAESDGRFGGAVVTPIWGSCGMALSATAGAPAGRSGASGRGCRHRVPGRAAGGRQRHGRRPGGLALPDARAAALGHAQGRNDAACERAKQQDYAAMVYARSRSPSFLTAGVARGAVKRALSTK